MGRENDLELGATEVFSPAAARSSRCLTPRHDQGAKDMSGDLHNRIGVMGIARSPVLARQPKGNAVAEPAIRTLKEQLLRVRRFATVEGLRLALTDLAALSRASWLRPRHGRTTPNHIRAEQKRLETESATEAKLAA